MSYALETPDQLADRIEAAARKEGIEASTFTQKHLRNSKLVERLRNGKGWFVRRQTYVRINELIGEPTTSAA